VRTLRLVAIGWKFHLKSLTSSGFFLMTSVFMPLLVATVAYYMFRAGHRPGSLFYASLGAAVYGIWSTTLFGSGGAIQWQRWQGTLEVIVAAPAPFLLVLLPLTLATSSMGVYSLASTLFWGRVLFGIPFDIAHPLLFALAIPVTLIGLGLLGLVIASSFVLYRYANALSNMLDWPILLISGLLVPLSLLPGWSHPVSWSLAPTWGMRAIRDAALGGGHPLEAIGMTLALSAVYLVIGSVLLRNFERLARRNATLSLT
jgi:ABC-type polysaccharide/polyol phosphate export permease